MFFVSHSTHLVQRLCQRAIYLENGAVKHIGGADEVTAFYDIDSLALSSDSLRKVQDRGVSADAGPAHIRELARPRRRRAGLPGPLPARGGGFPPRGRLRPRRGQPRRLDQVHAHRRRHGDVVAQPRARRSTTSACCTPGRQEIDLVADDLLLGDGQYDVSVALFEKRASKGETAFYVDPMTIWEKTHRIEVKRPGRPLCTLFDQPMRITVLHQGQERQRPCPSLGVS